MMVRYILTYLLAGHILALTSYAEIVTYKDETGRTHYVEGIEKVPERYRAKADTDPKLAKITKVPRSTYEATKGDETASPSSGKGRKVEVFVTSWCPYCKSLEKSLKSNNVSYKRIDIEKDKKGAATVQKLSGGGVPVTRIGDQVITGDQPEAIMKALGR